MVEWWGKIGAGRQDAPSPREGLVGDMRAGMIPSVVCEGRPGFFQNSRLREPPEIHRGHKCPVFYWPSVAGYLAPRLRTANFKLVARRMPSLGDTGGTGRRDEPAVAWLLLRGMEGTRSRELTPFHFQCEAWQSL